MKAELHQAGPDLIDALFRQTIYVAATVLTASGDSKQASEAAVNLVRATAAAWAELYKDVAA